MPLSYKLKIFFIKCNNKIPSLGMTLHRVADFYTKWFSVCSSITSDESGRNDNQKASVPTGNLTPVASP
jgi:hypothetical protein